MCIDSWRAEKTNNEVYKIGSGKNYSIKEFPVEWKDNARKVGIKKIWKFLIPALKLMFKLKFEKN